MNRKYFGTDGIRGKANVFPMTVDMALRVAMATALAFRDGAEDGECRRAVIGKDTRLSGYMLEQAMAAGFEAMGVDVIFVGPMPTPAVAVLTRSMRADVGVMISASHNHYEDNGIKLFGADGFKLSDSLEQKIESYIDAPELTLPAPEDLGKASRLDDAQGRYIEYLKRSVPRHSNLSGLKVVVDCAHGAAYKIAPQVLWELEAEVITIGAQPNGRNINEGFGATDTKALQERVVAENADVGIALDGDADRLIMVDETGAVVNGDQLLALIGGYMKDKGWLKNDSVVATSMSNLGLERYFASLGINLVRTPVGDRYVVEEMRANDFNLGGEQSGHIILSDFGTTGDGMLAALQALAILKDKGEKASTVMNLFTPLPQLLKNVRFSGETPLGRDTVKEAIKKAEEKLSNDGRLVVRPSGTESLIRVMAEGDNKKMVEDIVDDLCALIEGEAAS
jgi:phosphoglucosamine mutase